MSTLLPPVIDQKDVEDPSGRGRDMSLGVTRAARSIATGVVYWGTEMKMMTGLTEIMSTNSPVHLQV